VREQHLRAPRNICRFEPIVVSQYHVQAAARQLENAGKICECADVRGLAHVAQPAISPSELFTPCLRTIRRRIVRDHYLEIWIILRKRGINCPTKHDETVESRYPDAYKWGFPVLDAVRRVHLRFGQCPSTHLPETRS